MIRCKNHRGEIVNVPKNKFKFRPSVYGIIRNPQGEICVCRNLSDKKLWFPGGGIDVGESRKEALEREIKEETGLAGVEIGDCIGVFENFFYYEPTDEAMHAHMFYYDCKVTDTRLKSNDEILDRESRDFHWVDPKSVAIDDLADLNEEIWKMLNSLP